MCLYPRLIRNPKYKENKKNGGIIPQCYDDRQKLVPIGCGKCMECSKANAMNWKIRLTEEIKDWNKGEKHFVTLSFSNESLDELRKEIKGLTKHDEDNAIATLAIRRYLERWRKEHGKSVKHWFVTELGQKNTERIHLHGIMFTNNTKSIKEKWQYGNVWIGTYVNETTVGYIVKYIFKTDPIHKEYKPVILTSAGIGIGYMKRYNSTQHTYKENGKTKDHYISREGFKLQLPIYYRNKIYNDIEKEILWSEKLDKGIRYVDKVKIKIDKEIDTYIQVRKQARIKNNRLGYSGGNKNVNDTEYKTKLKQLNKIK